MKIALAGLAGVAAAWLIPRGGEAPAPTQSGSPSDRAGVTAAEYPLSSVDQGVTYRSIDGVPIFLVRSGTTVEGYVGVATTEARDRIFWCPKNRWFEDEGQSVFYGSQGEILRYSARAGLDRVRVLVSSGRVTVFPHSVDAGPLATFPPDYAPPLPPPPPPCSASERVG